MLTFTGQVLRLADLDLPRLGHGIGVGQDEVHAFLDVEAAGSGFDARGRVKMLFESRVFYRELHAGRLRNRAVREGRAYPAWCNHGYPADS